MSKQETDLPERLRSAGATQLERRLLEAAGREQPSRDLSERMARAIGVSMVAPGSAATGSAPTGTAVSKATSASSSLLPWISGTVVAVGVIVGGYVAMHSGVKPATPSAVAAPALSSPSELVEPVAAPQPADAPQNTAEGAPAKAAAALSPRGRRGTAAGELSNQIALVDAARSALASGEAQRALSIVREYQSEYPAGTFRPEVSAVKIEALVKLGRTAEARTLAERFVVAYGAGPLAERVARLAHIAEP